MNHKPNLPKNKAGDHLLQQSKVFQGLLIARQVKKPVLSQHVANVVCVLDRKAKDKNQFGYYSTNKQARKTATKVDCMHQKHLRELI